ncbi:hypothetical protein [Maribacter sp. LLG6340-A2]|uniref:hypothetical protein n=1 Tax=Maribacter sp. LLG6340-A2 TaxID=3160834 RepID=UPI00386A981A
MKRYSFLLLGGLFITLVSFSSFNNYSTTNESVDTLNNMDIEKQKVILTAYYTELIKKEIDKRFAESEDGLINEMEMIQNLALLTEYGCAYTNGDCTTGQVCGVSPLWAEKMGYSHFKSYNSGLCEEVDPPMP